MKKDTTQSTVLVTGAASGIGRAITKRCLNDGFTVHACDIDKESLQRLKSESPAGRVFDRCIDIANHDDVKTYFEYLSAQNIQPCYLVNNAGIYLGKNIFDYAPEEMTRVMSVNCLGAVYFSRYFAFSLINAKRSGVIVNMSSVAGEEGSSDAIYGLTKAALLGFTKSCAINFSPFIRVNAVAPALVSTSLIDKVPDWRQREYRAGELLTDPITPDDVADTIAFLLSDQSKRYTGAIFDINNGHYRR